MKPKEKWELGVMEYEKGGAANVYCQAKGKLNMPAGEISEEANDRKDEVADACNDQAKHKASETYTRAKERATELAVLN